MLSLLPGKAGGAGEQYLGVGKLHSFPGFAIDNPSK